MSSEISYIFTWYLFIVACGWCSFPLAFTLFRHFPDRGFSQAKALGLFLTSYVIWLFSSLGITPYHLHSFLVVLAAYVAFNILLVVLHPREIGRVLRERFALLCGIEVIFLLVFIAAVVIRMYNPDLTGAEKEADFTLLNAILHSDSFPPKDTWFAGAHINYYYLGYVIWANVIKATHISSPVGFNLALATIASLAAVGSFGIVYRFTRTIFSSLLASGMLMIFGNLDGLWQLVQRRGQLWPFDWWNSSRIIPDTINEFPYFSFLLGDLHAHFMVIPFVLPLLGLLAQLAIWQTHAEPEFQGEPQQPKLIYYGMLVVCIALFLGGTSTINGWEQPTYFLLTGLSVYMGLRSSTCWARRPRFLNIGCGLVVWICVGLLSRWLFWPFHQHFVPQIGIKHLQLVSHLQRTEVSDFFIIYGLFLWGLLPVFAERLPVLIPIRRRPSRNIIVLTINAVLLSIALFYTCQTERVFMIAAGISFVTFFIWHRKTGAQSADAFPFLLIFMGFAIVAGCEIIYINDFYGHPLERQNTIFKFYYQAWILLAVGVPVSITPTWKKRDMILRTPRFVWTMILLFLCCACCIYPICATYEKTNHFRGQKQGGLFYIPTLNGISYIAHRHPYEHDALMWIQKNLDKQVVILEATGDPYSFYGRVATTTGRSTVLGWGNHEALWRDQTWQSIQQRTKDITSIYEALDKTHISELLNFYHIDYIYVGTLEQGRYDKEGLQAFAEYFPLVYENAQIKIYQTKVR